MEAGDVSQPEGAEVLDREGVQVGRVQKAYLERITRRPSWVTIEADLAEHCGVDLPGGGPETGGPIPGVTTDDTGHR